MTRCFCRRSITVWSVIITGACAATPVSAKPGPRLRKALAKTPLTIHLVASKKGHRLLSRAVPRLQRCLRAFARALGPDVRFKTTRPERTRPDLERQGAKAVPFAVRRRQEVRVVNAYFSILLSRGKRRREVQLDRLVRIVDEPGGKRVLLDRVPTALRLTIRQMLVPEIFAPGSVVGLVVGDTGPSYRWLKQRLIELGFGSQEIRLSAIPKNIRVVLLLAPRTMRVRQVNALKAFSDRGGSLVVVASSFRLKRKSGRFSLQRLDANLGPLLEPWGLALTRRLALDMHAVSYPVPRTRRIAGKVTQRIEMIRYPCWPKVGWHGEKMTVPREIEMQWPVAVDLTNRDGIRVVGAYRTTRNGWLGRTNAVQPDFAKHPEKGFRPGTKRRSLAVGYLVEREGAQAAKLALLASGQLWRDDTIGILSRAAPAGWTMTPLLYAIIDWARPQVLAPGFRCK